jgi:hypothetical protein
VPAARLIDQNAPHRLRCGAVEVHPVIEAPAPGVHQTQERFVYQRRGLKRVTTPLTRHEMVGELAQLGVYQRHQLRERLSITVAPPIEQTGDVAHARAIVRQVGIIERLASVASRKSCCIRP